MSFAAVIGPNTEAPPEPARVLSFDGEEVREPTHRPSDDDVLRAYRMMRFLRVLDDVMLNAQRQGRIGFYGACLGQEAAVVGSALTLRPDDACVPALREGGAALLRGFPLQEYVDQVFGNDRDRSRGRQMPCHYGDRSIQHLSLSSPVANQLPQAVGMAYAFRLRGGDQYVLSYLGDGGTAESDFHLAMNFASLWTAPVVFFCQNNQWAISTPVEVQMATPTVAERLAAWGIEAVRVDGNDLFAVYEATEKGAEKARTGGGPTFIEALTYRVGAHSTSDDPSRYRDESITEIWRTERDPLLRLGAWLRARALTSDEKDTTLDASYRAAVKDAMNSAAQRPAPEPWTLFTDVYAEPPGHLQRQARSGGVNLPHRTPDRPEREAAPQPWELT